jgi:hypothetical protein
MIYIGSSTYYSHLDVATKQSNNENPTTKPKGKASSYIHPSIHPPIHPGEVQKYLIHPT